MKLENFSLDAHKCLLSAWLESHGERVPTDDEMPAIGCVARNERGIGVAMGFIRRVEGGFGHLDGLCTNPESPGSERHEAIDLIVDTLLKAAKEIGLKSVIAWSKDNSTIMRSEKHGFAQLPHTYLSVRLSN